MASRRSDSGQTLVFVALAMPVLLGFLGIGFDMGYMRFMKRQVQMAADAAAIAGADEITSLHLARLRSPHHGGGSCRIQGQFLPECYPKHELHSRSWHRGHACGRQQPAELPRQ